MTKMLLLLLSIANAVISSDLTPRVKCLCKKLTFLALLGDA